MTGSHAGRVMTAGCLAAAAAVLASCSGAEQALPDSGARTTASGVASASVAATATADADPTEGAEEGSGTETAAGPGAAVGEATTGVTGAPPTTGAPPAVPRATSTAPRTSPPPTEVVRLVDVGTAEVPAGEALTIRTEGGVPGYEVRYVDAVRVEGEPVLVQGEAFLEVVLRAADPAGEQGLSPDVAVSDVVDQELIQEVRFARYVDGVVTFAVGLSRQAEYAVTADDTGLTLTFVG